MLAPSRKPAALPFDPAMVSDEIVLAQARLALRSGAYDQAVQCCDVVVARASAPLVRCEALRLLANAHRLQCSWDAAIAAARREAQEAERAGLNDRVAEALNAEASVYLTRTELPLARPLLHRALGVASEPRLLGVLWQNLGMLEAQAGHFPLAEDAFLRSLAHFDRGGDLWGTACTLINTGCLRLDMNDLDGAIELLERAVGAGRAANDLDLVATAMMNRARALFRRGMLDDAEFSASSAAGFYVSSNTSIKYAECLIVLGDIERARGAEGIAMRCYRRGLETAESLGAPGLAEELRQRIAQSSAAAD